MIQANWPFRARGRLASILSGCLAVGLFVFSLVRCASTPQAVTPS